MQIKFLTLYNNSNNSEYDKSMAQYELLYMWQNSITKQYIKFIEKATVVFQTYTIMDYPDREKLAREIANACGYKSKDSSFTEYWWAGKRYFNLEALYEALASQKGLMELTIEIEDN